MTEEMTKVDVGNAGQPRLAARGGLGVPLSRGIQHGWGIKCSLFNLMRYGGELVDDLMMEYGEEKGYNRNDDAKHIVP